MNDKPKRTIALVSAPSLIGSKEFDQIHDLLKAIDKQYEPGEHARVDCWDEIIEEYRTWEQSFPGAHTSTVNRKMYLYKIIHSYFPNYLFNSCNKFVELILSDLRKPGDLIHIKLPDGTMGNATIIRREITERFGVLFTMESDKGVLFSHEFFD